MQVQVEIVRERARLERLEDEYRALLNQCAATTVFVTWEWLITWLDIFGHTCEPFVICVRDDRGLLVGVAPFKIASRRRYGIRVRQLEFIGTGEAVSPDRLDFVVHRGCDEWAAAQLIEAMLNARGSWDVLALTSVAPDALCRGVLAASAGSHARELPDRVCPYIQLPSRWEDCEARLGKSFNRHLKRGARRLFTELGVVFELLTNPSDEDIDCAIADLGQLHQDRMEHTNRGGNFRKTDYYAFHLAFAKRLATRGGLVLAFLKHQDRRIAARYGFLHNGTYYAYQSGFDREYERHSPSTVLLSCLIRHFIESGIREFDFLRGAQPHKYEWTPLDRRTVKLQAWNGPRGHWLKFNDMLRQTLKGLRGLAEGAGEPGNATPGETHPVAQHRATLS